MHSRGDSEPSRTIWGLRRWARSLFVHMHVLPVGSLIKFYRAAMNTCLPMLAHCSIWLCGVPDWPVFPLKPEQSRDNGLWWPDQRPCSETSPYGACPQLRLNSSSTVCHRLSFQQWTADQGGWMSNPFNPWLEKTAKKILFVPWYCHTVFSVAASTKPAISLLKIWLFFFFLPLLKKRKSLALWEEFIAWIVLEKCSHV